MDTFLEVLKWMGIALAAGFVGYFGRIPARILLEKITGKGKKTQETASSSESRNSSAEESKSQEKIDKKRAKQAAKIAKKTAKR